MGRGVGRSVKIKGPGDKVGLSGGITSATEIKVETILGNPASVPEPEEDLDDQQEEDDDHELDADSINDDSEAEEIYSRLKSGPFEKLAPPELKGFIRQQTRRMNIEKRHRNSLDKLLEGASYQIVKKIEDYVCQNDDDLSAILEGILDDYDINYSYRPNHTIVRPPVIIDRRKENGEWIFHISIVGFDGADHSSDVREALQESKLTLLHFTQELIECFKKAFEAKSFDEFIRKVEVISKKNKITQTAIAEKLIEKSKVKSKKTLQNRISKIVNNIHMHLSFFDGKTLSYDRFF